MNIIFRALFNQQMADRIGTKTYAPPPARARELRRVWSRTLDQLRAAAGEVAIGLHNELDNAAFAEELLDDFERPLPLIGLACLLEADAASPKAPAAERLALSRELARPLGDRIAELEDLFSESPARYLRALRNERRAFNTVARRRLGLHKLDGVGLQMDCAVTIDEHGPLVVGVKVGGSATATLETLGPRRRRRVALLSDGIARTARYASLEEAVRRALRP
jgi:hypothetical protein